ncbi:erythrocyte membrane protein 1 [Plasmodium falciparum RAJ116]|uniref:Erythrocyte membrane protein 1 n=1 Tax=Plasmodium falciparum RAJ116 TaxID=580058 RepID=A0A0L0CSC3_PLAFA|nr:erythrocyte membrane protein 1 [Plasmodium falciparum RAJ116]
MAPGSAGGGGGDIDDTTAKHLLDSIGKKVHDQVKNDAETYKDELKGNLQHATNRSSETVGTADTCTLVKEYYERLNAAARGERYPCTNLSGKVEPHFSNTLGGQCTKEKISGSTNTCGACAPFRRLHLCHHNLETIDTTSTKHDLLAEVCMAAKYEGDLIKTHYTIHKQTNNDSASQLCTVLARSFADIGDIVRGRDLFYGNPQEKEKREDLEKKLKDIFKNIYDKLKNGKTNGAEARYKDTDNYYELREDWWTANRHTVWEAMTCDAREGDKYFRQTACAGTGTQGKCRCSDNQVPTYFDYVPQYLRWFEEWAEDFCRLRKRKLEDAKNKCRGDNGTERYCDLNRYDCTQTASGEKKFVEKDDCKDCQYSCAHFVNWIDNQKLEFLKQKNKYGKEISNSGSCGGRRKKRNIRDGSNDNGYEKKFYKELKKKNKYGKVDDFLELLNNETTCTKNAEIKEGGQIDFKTVKRSSASGDGNNETFSHTTYCQACPWCGAEQESNGGNGWKAKDKTCGYAIKKDYDPQKTTTIEILTADKKQLDILKKYSKFCKNGATGEKSAAGAATGGDSQIKKWQCYYEGVNNDNCVEGEWKDFKEGQKVMSYNAFFWKWVHDMLIDSMQWRNEHGNCINKDNDNTCKNSCKRPCECFKRWVDQKKKTEWEAIKDHFKKQKDIGEQTHCDAGVTLQWVLILEFLKDESTEDTQNSLNAEEAKEIKHLRKMLEQAGVGDLAALGGGCTEDGVAEQDTLMDKLLDEEAKDATKCKQDCPKPQDPNLARSDDPSPGSPSPPAVPSSPSGTHDAGGPTGSTGEVDDSSHSSDEDDEDDEEEEGEVDSQQEEPPTTDPSVDVCNTVAKALTIDTLKHACSTKYGSKAPTSWKCISDSTTKPGSETARSRTARSAPETATSSSGAICVPPRRRRLYIQKLHDWAEKQVTPQAGGKAQTPLSDTPSQSGEKLREAFIESAAVETFFLWDRYKKEKKKPQGDGSQLLPLPNVTGVDNDNPQSKLEKGEIPNDFLRQMFYTLGDYRDICVGVKDDDVIKALEASGDNKSGNNIKEISEKIEKILKQIGSKPASGTPTVPQNNDEQRKKWWDQNAQHIWKGMICALTYTDSEAKGQTPTHNNDVYKKIFGENNGTPTGTAATQNGTYEKTYKYDIVKLDENSGTEATPTTQIASTTGENTPPKLKDFVLRPPYFRYLEEWGQNFCKERKKRLEKIRGECTDGGGKYTGRYCGGDGFDCIKIGPNKDGIIKGFDCPGCGRECRKYKKWIDIKKKEFDKQKNAYTGQKEKCVNGSNNHDNGVCGKLEENAAKFLQKLGSCKKDNKDNENGKGKTIFDDDSETFKHTKHCDPCPIFGIESKNSGWSNVQKKKCKDNGKDFISAEDIKTMKESIDVDMRVSDNDPNGFDDLNECTNTGIFKGIRKDVWECGEVCGIDVCALKKDNGSIDDKQIILIRALLRLWLEYFLEDYKKIKHKISHCTKTDQRSTCIKGCVEKWIERKRKEWENIKKRFLEQYKNSYGDDYNVRSFLEELIPQIDVTIDKKNYTSLDELEASYGCNCIENSKQENGQKRDVIDCMLKKLGEKAKECKENHTQPSGTDCHPSTTLEDDETFDDDIQTEEVKAPNICPPTPEPKAEEKGDCKAEVPQPDVKEEEEEKEEEKDKGNDQEEAASRPAEPLPPPLPPSLPPADQPLDPTILQTTIPFGVALALGSIAFLFLKKKTKSTIDLLRVINIPKSDYDIPTKLSPNRYIPYTSGKYRGKRYIYLEGDSGTDSGYTDHYSDITSSSESEYEEMDINDIYVPGSPKYKTLIEVVLEPSGKLSGNTIPTSGNNTTASGKNTPSDTQNDIQNDDTPSNKFTDNEWNTLKDEFISQYLQSEQPNDIPNDYSSGDIPLNTQPNTLYFDKPEEKPFIMSIHDRNLLSGEEYNYDMSTNSGNNNLYSGENNVYGGIDPTSDNRGLTSGKHDSYSGIDLINDSLSGDYDIYDELLKRKENELFGTNHTKKNTSTNSVAKNTNSDPILNQINLFHKWLDRHRDMCEKWNNKEEVLNKLKEEWENETHSGNTHPSDSNKMLNTDVSIQIHMDNPKPINEFTYVDSNPNQVDDTYVDSNPDNSSMDTILEDLDKYNEPYYDVQDDIYYDVNDHDTSTVDTNAMDVPSKVQIEMDINTKLVKEKYPIGDVWDI